MPAAACGNRKPPTLVGGNTGSRLGTGSLNIYLAPPGGLPRYGQGGQAVESSEFHWFSASWRAGIVGSTPGLAIREVPGAFRLPSSCLRTLTPKPLWARLPLCCRSQQRFSWFSWLRWSLRPASTVATATPTGHWMQWISRKAPAGTAITIQFPMIVRKRIVSTGELSARATRREPCALRSRKSMAFTIPTSSG